MTECSPTMSQPWDPSHYHNARNSSPLIESPHDGRKGQVGEWKGYTWGSGCISMDFGSQLIGAFFFHISWLHMTQLTRFTQMPLLLPSPNPSSSEKWTLVTKIVSLVSREDLGLWVWRAMRSLKRVLEESG